MLDPAQLLEPVLGLPAPLILLDGPSGAGKTGLALALREAWEARHPRALTVLHLDDFVRGWDDLAGSSIRLAGLLRRRDAGEPTSWWRYDWHRRHLGQRLLLGPSEPLLVEGCGSVSRASARLADLALILDAPEPVRRARAVQRDGSELLQHWHGWEQQYRLHARGEHAGLAMRSYGAVAGGMLARVSTRDS